MFIELLFSSPRFFAAITLVVVFSICAHEYRHAFAALKCGDPTAADAGHLTFNPFRQMGVRSLIVFCLIGIAWGQVPVNPENLRTRKARLAVALAGVSANLALAVIFMVLTALLAKMTPHEDIALQTLFYGAGVNLLLLVINLFPVPGFDGWDVLTEFWKPRLNSEFINGTFFVMVVLLFLCVNRIHSAAFAIAGSGIRFLTGVIS